MWSIIAALVGSLISYGVTRLTMGKRYNDYLNGTTGSGLTTAQQQQNSFTMQQQNAQQQFNAEQAALNRDWQERMSNTAYQRGTSDMIAAGLNPAMMYGGSAASASTPSGSAASSAAPAGSSPSNVQVGLLDSLMNLAFSAERMQSLKLDNERKRIDNAIADIDLQNHSQLVTASIDLTQQSARASGRQAELFVQQVKNGQMDNLLKQAQISKTEAEEVGQWFANGWQRRQNDFFDLMKDIRAESERLQNAKTEAEIKDIFASIGLKAAQTMSAEQQALLFGEETARVWQETRNLERTFDILGSEEKVNEAKARFAKAGQIVGLVVQGSAAFRDVSLGIGNLLSRGLMGGMLNSARGYGMTLPSYSSGHHNAGTYWDYLE